MLESFSALPIGEERGGDWGLERREEEDARQVVRGGDERRALGSAAASMLEKLFRVSAGDGSGRTGAIRSASAPADSAAAITCRETEGFCGRVVKMIRRRVKSGIRVKQSRP